ncbi:hypothetical protein EFD96_03760 [Pediococcus pentosaceus]|nr:hypothetical protein [Pediococcus pentosaceus]
MCGVNFMKRIITITSLLIPLIVGVIFVILKCTFKLSYNLLGFSSVLESIITFASIIIGFYTAMYGVLLTLKDSDIMISFRENKLMGILKFQLYDSLIASFMILILSILLQVLVKYPGEFTSIATNVWTFVSGYFISTSFRAILLLLRIMFNSDDQSKNHHIEDEPSTEEERNARYKRLNSDK